MCFDVSEERTASVFPVTESGSGGSWSIWEEINVSVIWQSLRNRRGILKTYIINTYPANVENMVSS
jgi:hypothetical protein